MRYFKNIVKYVCNVKECIGKSYFTFKKLQSKILKLGVEFKDKKIAVEYNNVFRNYSSQ